MVSADVDAAPARTARLGMARSGSDATTVLVIAKKSNIVALKKTRRGRRRAPPSRALTLSLPLSYGS
eukprot:7380893-Prymnesium_polylepis.1